MSVNKKDRCMFGNKEEQQRIYNQRRTINRLEQENQQLKDNWNELRLYCIEKMYFYSGTQNEDLEIDISAQDILKKMQELEGSDDDEC